MTDVDVTQLTIRGGYIVTLLSWVWRGWESILENSQFCQRFSPPRLDRRLGLLLNSNFRWSPPEYAHEQVLFDWAELLILVLLKKFVDFNHLLQLDKPLFRVEQLYGVIALMVGVT